MPGVPCSVCGWRRALARGLCHACYEFRRRTGRDRSEAHVVAHGRRLLEGKWGAEGSGGGWWIHGRR